MSVDHFGQSKRWYDNDTSSTPPFVLQAKSLSRPDIDRSFVCAAIFPWNISSFATLWNGEFIERRTQWQTIAEKWEGVAVVGGGSRLRFILTRLNQPYLPLFTFEVPPTKKAPKPSIRCAAWCMVVNADEILPLVAFASSSVLYIFDVTRGQYHGVLRGHGGQINHIAVHPSDPSYILTASHDYTCRLYDITIRAPTRVVNPSWPGRKEMALSGPAFGLRSNDLEGEGRGFGRCIAVLAGGPTGGHQAAVLCAEFHPTLPLIATSGMDHAVKIWRMPNVKSCDPLMIKREYRPLFSSTRVHQAQVLSISWIGGGDILLSHSGPITKRRNLGEQGDDGLYPIELWEEQGTMILWRWLGLDRYLPPGVAKFPDILRGCASDYQESSSFKIISSYLMPLPINSARAHVFSSPSHVPLVVLTSASDNEHFAGGGIRLSSLKKFRPRKRPPFPDFDKTKLNYRVDFNSPTTDADVDELAIATERMTTDDTLQDEDMDVKRIPVPPPDTLPNWHLEFEDIETGNVSPNAIKACAVGENGQLLICVGENEGVWIWRIPIEHE